MILTLLACDAPAVVYPVDPCRLGDDFSDVTITATCSGDDGEVAIETTFASVGRVGGNSGEDWSGLAFHVTGVGMGGETVSIGRRDDRLGVYVRDGDTSLVAGFLPSSSDPFADPYLAMTDGTHTCDWHGVGEVRVTGLPWGDWAMTFSGGEPEITPLGDWDPAWPDACALSPDSWDLVEASATCDGRILASYRLTEPDTYEVELDPLSRTGETDATWTDADSATCDVGAPGMLEVSLKADADGIRLYSPMLTLIQDGGDWAVEDTYCGSCADWYVDVRGLPEL